MFQLKSFVGLSVFTFLFASTNVQGKQNRVIHVKNQCNVDHFMLPVAGAAPFVRTSLSECHTNDDCIAGSSCLDSNELCYWDVPMPSTQTFRVGAHSSTELEFPYLENGHDIHWSGNIGFCANGTCDGVSEEQCGREGCSVNTGPINTAEFTLSKSGTDFYDVSIIAGMNVPMLFAPKLTSATYSADVPYHCGVPGATSNPNGQWQSTWKFDAPTQYNKWVSEGGADCTPDEQCSVDGEICGLSSVVGRTPQLKLTCGQLQGYWSANAVCAQDADFGAPFHCKQALADDNNKGLTLDNLIRCDSDIPSCYQPNPPSTCCGCVNWNEEIGTQMSPSATQQCLGSNPTWHEHVLPQLTWLKQGCPTCYTYPYDDMSSTFTCSQKDNGYNHIDYELTLCP
jgi:hypothetical protein